MTATAPIPPPTSDDEPEASAEPVQVTLVLPCLDEEASIAGCIGEAVAGMRGSGFGFEVLVVDNGSTDGSVARATAAGARVVAEPVRGYGAALQRGIAEARGEIVVMADADGTYELSRIPDLVRPVVEDRADLVLGERLQSADNVTMPFLHRVVGTPVLSLLNRRAAPGLTVTDSQSGFRAFRRDTMIDLDLRGTGMEFASEMLIRSGRTRLRIQEVPTQYRARIGDSKLSTFRDGLRHLRVIMLLAPHLFLLVPGLVLVGLGLMATVASLLSPEGISLGGTSWRPIYLATVMVVTGTLMALTGRTLVLVGPIAARRRTSDTMASLFTAARRTMLFGCAVAAVGIIVDLLLAVPATSSGLDAEQRQAVASFATSAILSGAIAVFFGSVGRLLLSQDRYFSPADHPGQ